MFLSGVDLGIKVFVLSFVKIVVSKYFQLLSFLVDNSASLNN